VNTKQPYVPPTLEKREQLADVTQQFRPGILSGGTPTTQP
jgi:hypothetical protein